MFRGNPQHSGVYEGTGLANFNHVKWKFHTAGQVISSPAVSAGTIYVGSTDGNLYAVDRESATLKWEFDAKSRITSSPAVSGGWFTLERTMAIFMRWMRWPGN
jgi:outer membrane protein assembly factor BamB